MMRVSLNGPLRGTLKKPTDWVTANASAGRFPLHALSLRSVKQQWRRSPVRWGLITVFALIGLVAAVKGAWLTAVAMAFFVAAQLASIVHERRAARRRAIRADPQA